MECRSIDQMRLWSCAGLGAHSGQPAVCWYPRVVGVGLACPRVVSGSSHTVGTQWRRSLSRGLLGVEGIATPEVKFSDRCKTNCGEGVLQVHVRRSRM